MQCDPGTLPPRVVMTIKPEDLPREVHDEAHRMLQACYAEAGYPTTGSWDGRYWVNDHPVPEAVQRRAALLVCERLRLPYRLVEADS